MTAAAYLIIGYLIFSFFETRYFEELYLKIFILTIIFTNYITIGYFAKISGYEFTLGEFLTALLTILSIMMLSFKKIELNSLFIGFLFIVCVMLGIFLVLLFPPSFTVMPMGQSWSLAYYGYNVRVYPSINGFTIKLFLRIVFFVIICLGFKVFISPEKWEIIQDKFLKFGAFTLYYCFFEFVLKYIFKSNLLNVINMLVFGQSVNMVKDILTRGSFVGLQGLTLEPSHLAHSLFFFTCVLILSKWNLKKKIFYFSFACFILLMSASFTGFMFIIPLAIIFIINERIGKKYILMAIIALGIFFLFIKINFNYFFDRFNTTMNIIVNSQFHMFSSTGSEGVRLYSIFETFGVFFKRPLFGVGIGNTYAHGFIPSILANLGLMGFVLWYIFVIREIAQIRINKFNVFLVLAIAGAVWIFSGDNGTIYSLNLLVFLISIYYSRLYSPSRRVIAKMKLNQKI